MRLLLVTGSGGAGATTVASATAVLAAAQGRKTVLTSLDADPASLADVVLTGADQLPPGEIREVSAGLSLARPDPRARLRRAGPLLRRLTAGDGAPLLSGLEADEVALLPGLAELVALLELRDLLRAGRWDVVVVDAGPVAQALRRLALPGSVAGHLDRLLPVRRRVARALTPGGAGLDDGVVDAALELGAALEELRALLTSAATGVRLVLTPDRAALTTGRRTLTRLAALGQRVDLVLVNRVLPADGADPWRSGWAARQRAELRRFEREVAPLPVRAVPHAPAEPTGADALGELGSAIHGSGAADDGGGVDPVTVGRDGEGFVLTVALPFVERADLTLARHDDDLVLGVGEDRRVLSLPAALRRCRVEGARLVGADGTLLTDTRSAGVADSRLEVRFVPDPALWRGGP